MNHTVSDTIIRIKNAALANRKTCSLPYSKMAKNILAVLKTQGFITNFSEDKDKKTLSAELLYINRMPSINEVNIISHPSVRVYENRKGLEHKKYKGLKNVVLSTSQGVMSGEEAMKKGLGGEVLFEVW